MITIKMMMIIIIIIIIIIILIIIIIIIIFIIIIIIIIIIILPSLEMLDSSKKRSRKFKSTKAYVERWHDSGMSKQKLF